jgi:hypothetical protein
MTGMHSPARIPAGVRAGAQFAPDLRPDAGVALSPATPSYAETVPLTDADLETLFRDPELPARDQFIALVRSLSNQHPYEVGRTRVVFHRVSDVIKVPITEEGLHGSSWEAEWSERQGKTGYIPIADAGIEYIDDLPVLRMERVAMIPGNEWKNLPNWTGSVDCIQVGYTAAGELVAFDL